MTQARFAAALLDPDAVAHARFDVYRNSVTLGLVKALEDGFPVIRALVGHEFFHAMATEFVRQYPPRSRFLMVYGAEFAAFMAAFPPAQGLPYLPDVARLEQALRESYHAADARPLPPDALKDLGPNHRLHFAPSVRLIRSDWPVYAIWMAHFGTAPSQSGHDVLVLRPTFDPELHPLPAGAGALLACLLDGATLSEALTESPANLDLTSVLTLLLDGNALVSIGQEPKMPCFQGSA